MCQTLLLYIFFCSTKEKKKAFGSLVGRGWSALLALRKDMGYLTSRIWPTNNKALRTSSLCSGDLYTTTRSCIANTVKKQPSWAKGQQLELGNDIFLSGMGTGIKANLISHANPYLNLAQKQVKTNQKKTKWWLHIQSKPPSPGFLNSKLPFIP